MAAHAAEPKYQSVQEAAQQAVRERPPEVLLESTRRFLQPLVGIDPASARVHLATHETPLTGKAAATHGDDVVLAPGQHGQSPESLGLLAHELTHTAIEREPGFIPPAVGETTVSREQETLAQQVEARVIAAAHNLQAEQGTAGAPDVPPTTTQQQPPADDRWGGLPAPWEPMPEWFSTAFGAPPPGGPDVSVASGASAPPALVGAGSGGSNNASGGGSGGRGGDGGGMAFADETRSLDTGSDSASAAADSGATPAQVEADLDALARQVYSILKRRLSAERRRGV